MSQNMDKLIQQAHKMQEQMQKMQQEQKKIEIEGQSGAGLVKIKMSGRYDIKKVTLDPSVMLEKKEILEDLIAAAINNAINKIEEKTKLDMSGISKNVSFPTGFKFPF